jgi:sugar phosphate isomerase/epimerase
MGNGAIRGGRVKLGLLTAAFAATPIEDVADWAAANGYAMLEVACWPRDEGAARRYAGVSHIDVVGMSADRAQQIVGDLRERGVEISGLGYYPNPLHPDPEHRARVHEHLRQVISAAALMGVPVVNTFAGADARKSQSDNFADFRAVWPDLVAHAADHGVKIGIENCPMIFSADEWPAGHNLAYSPAIWRQMFEVLPGDTLGLNLDPSHLVWQMIDVERVVREFGPRIYHVHGKDLEIDRDGLYDHGVMSAGIGWQVPRLPGLGEVDWPRFVAALYAAGYDHVLCVEHEDRRFEGTEELVKRGFHLARQTLAPLIA